MGDDLPKNLIVQMDNCPRDNKNNIMFGFLGMLQAFHVFETVECHFLPAGHTHEDVDAMFSRFAFQVTRLSIDHFLD